MQHFAPIALFVYNRPVHTERTIKFLKQNVLASESRLFIFSDGAKNEAIAALQALGYKPAAAETMITKIAKPDLDVEQVIRAALRSPA